MDTYVTEIGKIMYWYFLHYYAHPEYITFSQIQINYGLDIEVYEHYFIYNYIYKNDKNYTITNNKIYNAK